MKSLFSFGGEWTDLIRLDIIFLFIRLLVCARRRFFGVLTLVVLVSLSIDFYSFGEHGWKGVFVFPNPSVVLFHTAVALAHAPSREILSTLYF